MAQQAYNLDENQQEFFEFILGGFTYKLRYPNTEEVQELQKLGVDVSSATDEEKVELSKKIMDWLYPYVTAEDEKAPPISDAVKVMPINKLKLFNEMIRTEFGMS